jgi:hypothetical protein
VATHFDTVNSRLLLVYDDSFGVTAQNSNDCFLVPLLIGRAKVKQSTVDTGEDALQTRNHFAELCLAFTIALVHTSLKQLVIGVLEFLVDFGLFDAACQLGSESTHLILSLSAWAWSICALMRFLCSLMAEIFSAI